MKEITIPIIPEVGIITLVPDEWDSPWQSRHHIVNQLRLYFPTVWVNPATEWRQLGKVWKSYLLRRQTQPSLRGLVVYHPEPWLPLLYRPRLLASIFLRQRLENARDLLRRCGCQNFILYLWRPGFASALTHCSYDLSCYHIDDEYSFSNTDLSIDEQEMKLLAGVDQVFVHSIGLFEKKGKINPHTTLIPNGVDYQLFAQIWKEPDDMAVIPRPRIGYTGVLKSTLDWDLLVSLVIQHPEWSFVFVGPQQLHREVAAAAAKLEQLPNAYFLGAKSLQDLATYPQHFDVCLMPYRRDSHSVKYGYPLKLHEYLAGGKPTIGSRLRSLEAFSNVVALVTTLDEWSHAITKALEPGANTNEWQKARQFVARQHDWRVLVLQIARALTDRLGNNFTARLREISETSL